MSLMRCEHCDEVIDTDFDAEHFDDDAKECKEQVNKDWAVAEGGRIVR